MAKYLLTDVRTSPHGAVKADLTEDGVVIARVTRAAGSRVATHHYSAPFQTKFLSTQSKQRFDSFCDCLSIAEVVEILHHNSLAKV